MSAKGRFLRVAAMLFLTVCLAAGCSKAADTTGTGQEEERLVIPGNERPGDEGDAVTSGDSDPVGLEELGEEPDEPDGSAVEVSVDPGDATVAPPGDEIEEEPEVNPDQPCVDLDQDGYGPNCYLGADCDDSNPNFAVYCPPCGNQSVEGCKCSQDGAVEVCYEGDPGSVGIGECQLGQRFCQSGFWTGCIGQIVPKAEDCNDLDDDCDGSVDEGVLSPCGNCDPFCDTLEAGPGTDYPFEINDENSDGVGTNLDGFLILDSSQLDLGFIWIANSGEGTVSKLDTDTGEEIGRYKTCSDPSRTAVDLLGNVYVGCRADGGVAKIAIDEMLCKDKNGNGIIDTSHDSNWLPAGQDECILYITYPGGSCARALGVDANNNVWVGDWSGKTLKNLEADTGQVLQSISINCNPYGLVIDGSGIIWVSGRGCNKLVRVDPANNNVQHLNPPTGNMYGITVDQNGLVWMGHYSSHGISRYNPANGNFDWITSGLGGHCPRGMAGTTDGYMYSGLGCGGDHYVAKVNIETLQVKLIDIGGGNKTTVGVAMDSNDHIWAVNYQASSATKINNTTEQVVGEYPVGYHPYTYSDMTGYALHNFTAPQGQYTTTFGGWEEIRVKWTALFVEADLPDQAYIEVEVRTANTAEEMNMTPWQGKFGPYPPQFFPLDLTQVPATDGKLLQVRVWLYSKDKLTTPVIKSIQAKFSNE